MTQAKQGDTVTVHYTGRLTDGTVFDSSNGGNPLEFIIGEGQIIPGFEEAVVGMSKGESKTTHIPIDQGYGPHRPEMVVEVNRTQLPTEIQPEIGQQLQIQQPDGQAIPVVILSRPD